MRKLLLALALVASPALAVDVNPRANGTGTTTEVVVSNTVQTPVPATPLPGRRSLLIQNLGPNAITCALGDVAHVPTAVLTKGLTITAAGTGATSVVVLQIGENVIVNCLAGTANQATGAATIAVETR